MSIILEFGPHLATMALLVACSAFFSGCEAALFYLGLDDRRALQGGNPAQRKAAELLGRPERLLSAILFWNLLVNMVYFATGSIVGLRLQRAGQGTEAGVAVVTFFVVLIVFSEMLPKIVAVSMPRFIASLFSFPLAAAIRFVDPLLPILRHLNMISRRMFLPRFESEPYLETSDLERAIALSTTDKALVEQERAFLANIVALSEIRVEELMRPRLWYHSFRPPVRLADLQGQLAPAGCVLVTEPDSDEVAASIPLDHLAELPPDHLEQFAQPVLYFPWCATVAAALESMRRGQRHVAAVLNEHGETVGILTLEDILDTVVRQSTRSERLLHKAAVKKIDPVTWEVSGMTTLRRLSKLLGSDLPETASVTVAGVLHELLQRLPQEGDEVQWGPVQMRVTNSPENGSSPRRLAGSDLTVRLTHRKDEEADE